MKANANKGGERHLLAAVAVLALAVAAVCVIGYADVEAAGEDGDETTETPFIVGSGFYYKASDAVEAINKIKNKYGIETVVDEWKSTETYPDGDRGLHVLDNTMFVVFNAGESAETYTITVTAPTDYTGENNEFEDDATSVTGYKIWAISFNSEDNGGELVYTLGKYNVKFENSDEELMDSVDIFVTPIPEILLANYYEKSTEAVEKMSTEAGAFLGKKVESIVSWEETIGAKDPQPEDKTKNYIRNNSMVVMYASSAINPDFEFTLTVNAPVEGSKFTGDFQVLSGVRYWAISFDDYSNNGTQGDNNLVWTKGSYTAETKVGDETQKKIISVTNSAIMTVKVRNEDKGQAYVYNKSGEWEEAEIVGGIVNNLNIYDGNLSSNMIYTMVRTALTDDQKGGEVDAGTTGYLLYCYSAGDEENPDAWTLLMFFKPASGYSADLSPTSGVLSDKTGATLTVTYKTFGMETVSPDEESNGFTEFPESNIVTVNKKWTLTKGAYVIIRGQLVVPEGAKLVIEHDAVLILTNEANLNAAAIIDGTMIVNTSDGSAASQPGRVYLLGGTMQVNEELSIGGVVRIADGREVPSYLPNTSISDALNILGTTSGRLIISADADVTVESEGTVYTHITEADPAFVDGVITYNGIVISDSAVLTVEGKVNANIYNSGKLVLDTTADSDERTTSGTLAVYQITAGAVVDIQQYTATSTPTDEDEDDRPSLTVSDAYLQLYYFRDVNKDAGEYPFFVTPSGVYSRIGEYSPETLAKLQPTIGTNILTIEDIRAVTDEQNDDDEFDGVVTVTGLEISSEIQTYTIDGIKYYDNEMAVSGDISASRTNYSSQRYTFSSGDDYNGPFATITLSAANMTVSDDMILGPGITLAVEDGIAGTAGYQYGLTVSGTIDATDEDCNVFNSGEITVVGDGFVSYIEAIEEDEGDINAVTYTTGKGKDTLYNYVSFDAALVMVNEDGNTVKALEALGTTTAYQTNSIPENVTLTVSGTVNIGTADDNSVVITLEKGATLKSGAEGMIDVCGTLYAKDYSDVGGTLKNGGIVSDVFTQQMENDKPVKDGWAKWTNVRTALSEAEAGDVVEISRTEGFVQVSGTLEIPEGVTLYVGPNVGTLVLLDGATLQIDGTFETEQTIYAETRFGTSAMDADIKSSLVVVNGYYKTTENLKYGNSVANDDPMVISESSISGVATITAGAPIYGVYYEIMVDSTSYVVISPLQQAIDVIEDAVSNLTVHGVVTAGDIAFPATDYCDTIIVSDDKVIVTATLNNTQPKEQMTQLTVSNLALEISSSAKYVSDSILQINGGINGNIISGESAVELVNVMGPAVNARSVGDAFTVTAGEQMVLTGIATNYDSESKILPSITVSKGTIVAGKKGTASNPSLVTAYDVAVIVPAGSVLNVINAKTNGLIDVSGELNVVNDGESLDASNLNVEGTGTYNVAPATSNAQAGRSSVATMFAYPDSKVNGKTIITAVAYVYGGANVDKTFQEVLDSIKNTTDFNVEDSVWMTAYAAVDNERIANYVGYSAQDLGVTDPTTVALYNSTHDWRLGIENAKFRGWLDENGRKVTTAYVGGEDIVYASIDYKIYHVRIAVDYGITNVAVDGNLVNISNGLGEGAAGGSTYSIDIEVTAGQHKVSFDLPKGFEGTAKLSVNELVETSDNLNISVSGMIFTVSGTPDYDEDCFDVVLQLQGIVNTGGSSGGETGGDDGLSITDILLIILVVLIVIVAIMVALRMMRS